MTRRWSKPLFVFTAAAAVVALLIFAGQWTRQWLQRRGHYDVALADLAVTPPPGLDRAAFLSEVQYLGGLPDRISTMDSPTVLRLAAAFAAHPWVEQVERIALRAPDGPAATLRFRSPVLAVNGRVVDGAGVLLPENASTAGLLQFRGVTAGPCGPAGARWGDPAVEQAARIAKLLGRYQDRLQLREVTVQDGALTFTGLVTVHWGPPDPVEDKVARLSELLAKSSSLPERIDLNR